MTAADVGTKRVTAGILGVVLGAFGAHKFIIGRRKTGLLMLVLSLVSVGLLLPIFFLIGLIEGLVYLSKSDEEFYAVYLRGSRCWF